jgi:hypothetical protein
VGDKGGEEPRAHPWLFLLGVMAATFGVMGLPVAVGALWQKFCEWRRCRKWGARR